MERSSDWVDVSGKGEKSHFWCLVSGVDNWLAVGAIAEIGYPRRRDKTEGQEGEFSLD